MRATPLQALAGNFWRERLRKRGHCFFLLLEHWVKHTAMAMGVQPGESVDWKVVPGYPQLIKAFLLEMKQRPTHRWVLKEVTRRSRGGNEEVMRGH